MSGSQPSIFLKSYNRKKIAVQQCLYQLKNEGKVQKVDEKHWTLCGETGNKAAAKCTSLVPLKTVARPLVSYNGSELSLLQQDVLSRLSNWGSVTALQLAKSMGYASKKSVNPALYALKTRGLVKIEGSTWSIVGEGDSTGSGRVSEQPSTHKSRADPSIQVNQYHLSITHNYGDQVTNIQQHGVSSNNITGGAHGNCYIQVGSQNTMTGREDPSQGEEGKATPGRSEAVGTEAELGGNLETGGTGDKEGGVSGTGTEFHIDVMTDQLSGLQIGNSNQMKICCDPTSEDSASEDPLHEDTEE
ncbi:Z-DNA-binding protein 1-like [Stegostoma tigrinum]|uniref:Z-DNA-binding protein 1-like n=1 Tax=Stegostoma tigrinum TaxID=3053191 RepID=UPI0028709A65|nr:Z-DNA-binding protein 1-like [Stegostoma tigrinum]XP_048381784.2 Z-DNA-binding protein 1-like [Stegostoma tigrinum]XP_048381785.2 Z-DNA-binding protein 1-like [Stegostoma tigrinum]XP_059498275.1 Z-DNA-binding protein 1-like [Stegostoma tigrinum]XP_059498276.1 Z-DNA-binding protein 1-like [Stegostoma tigrinum]